MKNKDWLPKSVNYLTQTAALMGLEVQGFNLHNNVHLTHKTGGLNPCTVYPCKPDIFAETYELVEGN
jgi:hypothetical protein